VSLAGFIVGAVALAVALFPARRFWLRLRRIESEIVRLGMPCTCKHVHSEGCPTVTQEERHQRHLELADLKKDRAFLRARLMRLGALPADGPELFHGWRIKRVTTGPGGAPLIIDGQPVSPVQTWCAVCQAQPRSPGSEGWDRCVFGEGEIGIPWDGGGLASEGADVAPLVDPRLESKRPAEGAPQLELGALDVTEQIAAPSAETLAQARANVIAALEKMQIGDVIDLLDSGAMVERVAEGWREHHGAGGAVGNCYEAERIAGAFVSVQSGAPEAEKGGRP
jgi:hypothetical protein